MKVYALPADIPPPEVDYANFDREKMIKAEADHRAKLKDWLKRAGYTGKRTGEVARFPVADGYAEYMLADGKKSALIHLPYGDGWNYAGIEYMPKKAIIESIEREKRIAALFRKEG